MAKKASGAIGGASSTSPQSEKPAEKSGTRITRPSETHQKPSSLLDTRVVYCGDNLEQLAKLPDACVDLIYPATAGRPRCVQLARVLKKTGSFYYHCDWHASHYVKVMLDQIFRNCKCNCA
jgi:hypothetical protein